MLCSGQKKVASYPSAVHPYKLSYVQMDACPGYFIQVCLPSFQTRFLLPGWTHSPARPALFSELEYTKAYMRAIITM